MVKHHHSLPVRVQRGVEISVPPGSAECAGAAMNLLCALKLNYANTTNTWLTLSAVGLRFSGVPWDICVATMFEIRKTDLHLLGKPVCVTTFLAAHTVNFHLHTWQCRPESSNWEHISSRLWMRKLMYVSVMVRNVNLCSYACRGTPASQSRALTHEDTGCLA